MEQQNFRIRLRDVPHQPGIYLMKDRIGSVIYVGKAKDLRKRLANYFLPSRKMKVDVKTRALIASIWDFEIRTVKNEQEALLLEGRLIKDFRPRYNITFRDDKRFLLVKIKLSDSLPRFMITRLRKDDGAKYFGPFAHSSALRSTIEWLNRSYGLRTCTARHPNESDYKHCHADVIQNCSAPCIQKISQADYHARVEEVCKLLGGKGKREAVRELDEAMHLAAQELQFEKAAMYRNIKQNLELTLNPARLFTRGNMLPSTVNPTEDVAELGDALGLSYTPTIMECFDISNISSTHIVASMVRFVNGKPDNQSYRRYRIKTVAGQDDFASMAEVIRRRYSRILLENTILESQENPLDALRRLAKEGKAKICLPDLVIVDGGKGQLSMAVTELQALGLHELPVIGLAKQREEVFFPNKSEPLVIPHERGALKLLQRIRDEAHRFANNYNSLLLKKRMSESLLDECPSITTLRKKKLLSHFNAVSQIKKASLAELSACEGISKTAAKEIYDWFRQ